MMLQVWQLQEAKNRLSEVVEQAIRNGPQIITRRGVESAVLISYSEFRKLTASPQKLSDFFRESPLADVALDLHRDASPARAEPVL